MKLFLDDCRSVFDCTYYLNDSTYRVRDGWTIVRNYNEFKTLIHKMVDDGTFKDIELISLDNDLEVNHYMPQEEWEAFNQVDLQLRGTDDTGLHCAALLVTITVENDLPMPEFLCHSQNPVAKQNILTLLNNFRGFHKVVQDYNEHRSKGK